MNAKTKLSISLIVVIIVIIIVIALVFVILPKSDEEKIVGSWETDDGYKMTFTSDKRLIYDSGDTTGYYLHDGALYTECWTESGQWEGQTVYDYTFVNDDVLFLESTYYCNSPNTDMKYTFYRIK